MSQMNKLWVIIVVARAPFLNVQKTMQTNSSEVNQQQ